MGLGLVQPTAVLAGLTTNLLPSAQDCLQTGREASCHQALVLAESLQRKAARAERNSCQSMTLGLQADVLMVQLKNGRGDKAFDTLRDVQRHCQGL
jgi:hypothetical protein